MVNAVQIDEAVALCKELYGFLRKGGAVRTKVNLSKTALNEVLAGNGFTKTISRMKSPSFEINLNESNLDVFIRDGEEVVAGIENKFNIPENSSSFFEKLVGLFKSNAPAAETAAIAKKPAITLQELNDMSTEGRVELIAKARQQMDAIEKTYSKDVLSLYSDLKEAEILGGVDLAALTKMQIDPAALEKARAIMALKEIDRALINGHEPLRESSMEKLAYLIKEATESSVQKEGNLVDAAIQKERIAAILKKYGLEKLLG